MRISKNKKRILTLLLSMTLILAPQAVTLARAADEPAPVYTAGQFGDPYITWTAEGANNTVLKGISDAIAANSIVTSKPLNANGLTVLYNAGGKYIQQGFTDSNAPRATYNALQNAAYLIYTDNSPGASGNGGWLHGGAGANLSRNRSAVGSPVGEMVQVSGSVTLTDPNLRAMNGTSISTFSASNNLKYQNFTYGYLVRNGQDGAIYFSRGYHLSNAGTTFTITPIPEINKIGAEMNYWQGDGEGYGKLNLDFENMVKTGLKPHTLAKAINDAAAAITDDGTHEYDPKVITLNTSVVLNSDLNSYYRRDTEKVVKVNGIYMQMLNSSKSTGVPFKPGSQLYVARADDNLATADVDERLVPESDSSNVRNMFIVFNPDDNKAYPIVDEIATLYGNGVDYETLGTAADYSNVTAMGYPLEVQYADYDGKMVQHFSNGYAEVWGIGSDKKAIFYSNNGERLLAEGENYYNGLKIEKSSVSLDVGSANSKQLKFSSRNINPNDEIVFVSQFPEFVTVDSNGVITGVEGATYGPDGYATVIVGIHSKNMVDDLGETVFSDIVTVYVKPGGFKAAGIAFKETEYEYAWNKHFAPEVVITSEISWIPVTNDDYTLTCDNPLVKIEGNDVVKNDIITSGQDAVSGVLTVSLPQGSMVSGASNSDTAPIRIYPSTTGLFDPGFTGSKISWFSNGGRTKATYSQAFIDAYIHIAFEQGYIMGEASKDESRIREWNGYLVQEFLSDKFEYSIWNRKHAYLIIDNPSRTGGTAVAYPLMSPVLKWMSENSKGFDDIGAPRSYEYRAHGMMFQNYARGLMVINPDYRLSKFMEGYRVSENGGQLTIYNQSDNAVQLTSVTFAAGSTAELEAGKTGNVYAATNNGHPFAAVSFAVSDESVLKVDALGNIEALKAGTAVITMTSLFNPALISTLTVTVTEAKETENTDTVTTVENVITDKSATGWEITEYVLGPIVLLAGLAAAGLAVFKFRKRKPAAEAAAQTGTVNSDENTNS